MNSNLNANSALHRVLLLPELTKSISKYLRQVHLCQLRLACKSFQQAFAPHVTFAIHQTFGKIKRPDLQLIEKSGFPVRSLNLDILDDESNIESFLENHQTIKHVKVRWWGKNIAILFKIIKTQPNLQSLVIELSGKGTPASIVELLELIATKVPRLESLTLFIAMKNCLCIPWSSFLPIFSSSQLQRLNIRGFTIEHYGVVAQFNQIKSLVLSDVNTSHDVLMLLIRSMANIISLSLHLFNKGDSALSFWERLTGPIDNPSIILQQLKKLRVGTRKGFLTGLTQFIISCCPTIQDLELFDECQYIKREDIFSLVRHFNDNGIQLRRLAVDHIPTSSIDNWIRAVLEECCPYLEELEVGSGIEFMVETQTQAYKWRKNEELEMTDHGIHGQKYWFPFRFTIRKLHLNSMYSQQLHRRSDVAKHPFNDMLRDMPLLDDLAIMDLLYSFDILEGLGRCKNSGEMEDLEDERPYLRQLKIGVRSRFNAESWERELVYRFRFLEVLTVRTVLLYSQMEQFLKWQEELRPDLSISLEHIEQSRMRET